MLLGAVQLVHRDVIAVCCKSKEAVLTTAFLIMALAAILAIALAVIVLQFLNLTIRHGINKMVPLEPQATVTATLELDSSDRKFVNLVVANAGAAPAFDVRISITPEIPTEAEQEKRPTGWADVSLLRPGQAVPNFACETAKVVDLDFAVNISWKSVPDAQSRTSLSYTLKTSNLERQVPLSAPGSEALLAEVRRLRRDWQPVARGRLPLRIELSPEPVRASGQETSTATTETTRRQRN
jgi:hypothetical protein